MWYVGYVERPAGVWDFALEMGDKDFDRLFPIRVSKAREILAGLAILPAPGGSQ